MKTCKSLLFIQEHGIPLSIHVCGDTTELLRNTAGQTLILSPGCALGRNTKPENVEAMINARRNFRG